MTKKAERSLKDKFALKSNLLKEALAEFLGTFILIALGCGCIAQSVLSRGALGGAPVITIGFAMSVTMAVYVAGGVSGGHVNPAVSFAMCLTGRMNWVKFPVYVLAQCLGAFVGAAAVFGVNYDALMAFTGGEFQVTGPNATAHIFATYPEEYLSLMNGFADQVMSTAFLLLGVFAIFDEGNLRVQKGLEPIAIGLLIILLCSSLAMNSGCAMNPARDLAPRIFTYLAGWGTEVFTAGSNWWWVPVVGPMVGAAFGAGVYILFIELHHAARQPRREDAQLDKYELADMAEGKPLQGDYAKPFP
ncbi:aquaporin-9 [Varanus komodoensis]|uniref:Aquaporin 9 n=1 Tax=Varanus komodoensis TaxID=61221 RepID=A0A8D2LRS5_VARKO|nr:aquaporin-9 [Varanus komodoensis]